MTKLTMLPGFRLASAMVFASVFLTFFGPSPGDSDASASEYSIAPCSGTYASQAWTVLTSWTDPDPYHDDPPPWRLEFECPYRMVVRQPALNNWHLPYTWSYSLYPEGRGPIKRITAILQSGPLDADVKIGIRACSGPACAAIIEPDSHQTLGRQAVSLTEANGLLPQNVDRLLITAACTSVTPCPAGDAMSIYDLKIFREDDEKPTVDLYRPPVSAPPISAYLRLDNWNNGTKLIGAEIRDSGAGVRHVYTTVADWELSDDQNCESYALTEVEASCPGDLSFVRPVDLDEIRLAAHMLNGQHTLTVRATDAAGNRSDPVTANFKYDNQPPVIGDLHMIGALPGRDAGEQWQSDPYASLRWANYPENAETQTTSGVAGFTYALHRSEGTAYLPAVPKIQQPAAELLEDLEFPSEGLWHFTLWTFDRAGNRSDRRSVSIGYDSTIPSRPMVDPISPQNASSAAHGVYVSWTPPENNQLIESQVCNYAASLDSNPTTDPGAKGTIPGNATSHTFFPPLLRNTMFLHIRANSCSGVSGRLTHVAIETDPDAPTIVVSKPSSSGWFSGDSPPSIHIDDERGLASAAYSIDGEALKPLGGSSTTLDLADGDHDLLVTASDSSGNFSTSRSTLRIDRSPPHSSLLATSKVEPLRVSAESIDNHSGVAGAQLQYRAAWESKWHDLAETIVTSIEPGGKWRLTAYIPDLSLAEGDYELRIVSTDHAGNRSESSKRIDGSNAGFAVPLRSAPGLKIGFAATTTVRKCARLRGRVRCKRITAKPNAVLQTQKLVSYGRTATLDGQLNDPLGLPVVNTELVLRESGIDLPSRITQRTRTNGQGSFAFKPAPGITRTLTVDFAGSPTLVPARASATLFSKSKVTLRARSSRMKSGSIIRLTGRVLATGATFPRLGKRIEFQFRTENTWKHLPVSTNTDQSGRFAVNYLIGPSRRPIRWKIRAEAGPQESWPYETAESPSVTKVVGG